MVWPGISECSEQKRQEWRDIAVDDMSQFIMEAGVEDRSL